MIEADIKVVLVVMSTGGLQGAHHIDVAGTTLLLRGDQLMVEGLGGNGLGHLHILLIVQKEIMVIADEAIRCGVSMKTFRY